ncbi:MAG: hypothetical protein A2998_00535 [Candidatus Staskawiczbacteria bacterium RIFCSPLOWO2_01_FULL_37_25b]|uniref:Transcription regulator AsnC/Lrp ligand binding domain-containing protein n=2 Tax=Candidatus Staskawicziibacteriota TaxID=1817916 RepID=A0A1G2HK54_9BACT|nr:MAG: hypothetical protein A2812_00405 [Candidatus Staskawiczbacteria bacterium RIFCSPHIGHO2_01_FULL_36_16]OGZ71784.1 MAG: hypothetical protein A2998_00535 [Candidatus Staskawiczbacteria bacterium RIFCSPLOWO2_01_FULL_37_25b]
MIIIAFLEQDVDIDAVASKIRKLNYEVAIRYHVRVLRINVLNNSKDEALKKIRSVQGVKSANSDVVICEFDSEKEIC